MSSWIIIIILIILLIVCFGMLLLFHWDIKRMTIQLDDIIENFGTNELVRTNTHNKTLIQFITRINQLIHLFKQDQQYTEKKEQELKQEMTHISHDLRTPLTSIKGFTELLTDSSLSEADRQAFLNIIQKKIDHLTMVADLFYERSQIESSDKQLMMDQQLLDQIVIDTMLMFYDDFDKSQLKVTIDEETLPPIWADKKATHRIITNIIQNALRYAKSYFTIQFIEEEQYVHLVAVNDIDPVNFTKVNRFDRVFQQDINRTKGHLGLGLHIVQQLINLQDGEVAVNVQDDEFIIDVSFMKWNETGTSFTFDIQ